MKKLSVLFVALAVAVSASAGIQVKSHRQVSNRLAKESVAKFSGKMKMAQAPAKAIISEQPEGEVKTYTRTGEALVYNSGVRPSEQSGKIKAVYDADGTTVYLQNLVFGQAGYWIKGTIDGNTITVPLGQEMAYYSQYDANIVLAWGTTYFYDEQDENGEMQHYIGVKFDEEKTDATFTIDGETISLNDSEGDITAEGEAAYVGTGLTSKWDDDNSWTGYMNWKTVLTEAEPLVIPTLITEQPEGELFTFMRKGACIYNSYFGLGSTEFSASKLNVVIAEADGKAYIQNPMWWFDSYNTWVEGTYDASTGIISIPVGQYLTFNEENEYGIQLMWGSTYVYQDVDENGEEGYYMGTELDEDATEIKFQIEGDVITLLGSEGDLNAEFPENYNATGLYAMYSDDQSWAASLEFNVTAQILNVVPAVPADPIVDPENAWTDGGNENGWTSFRFTLPTEDIDGNPLDPESLSYCIFMDDEEEPFVFDAATYSHDLTEDMSEIPILSTQAATTS